jgi:YfiH family protein
MYNLKEVTNGKFSYLTSPAILKERSVFIAFTNRFAGVSKGLYESLNFSFNVGDRKQDVENNRLFVSKKLGLNKATLTLGKQVHGNNVGIVDKGNSGSGSFSYHSSIKSTDSLITGVKDISLVTLTADCLPVILFDKKNVKVAVVHCGWRGLASGVIFKTLKYLNSSETLAFLGPAIGRCCFEVGKEVAEALGESLNENEKYKVSLEEIAINQLIAGNVLKNNIYPSGICTVCNADKYFSYRASGGLTGRQSAIAVIK